MMSRVTALVRVEVELHGSSVWGADTTVEQVTKQATDDFMETIRTINGSVGTSRIRIVGVPHVEIVTIAPTAPNT